MQVMDLFQAHSKEFYATVTDVKEAPTNITISNNSVPENIFWCCFWVVNIRG